MNTLDVISSRRSIRSFTKDTISEKNLLALIKAAADAPSGGNEQNWQFISIQEPARIKAVRALSPGMVSQPAAVIAICLDRRQMADIESDQYQQNYYDLGAAMQNILLAAHALGLGSCAIASFNQQGLKQVLCLPERVDINLLVAIGKPKVIPSPPPKKPLEKIYHREKFE